MLPHYWNLIIGGVCSCSAHRNAAAWLSHCWSSLDCVAGTGVSPEMVTTGFAEVRRVLLGMGILRLVKLTAQS